MNENASLSDYLFELRRAVTPGRLMTAIGLGALCVAVGLFRGALFAGLTGFGLAIAGVCAWARLNQIADAAMDGRFSAQQPARARQLRAVGVVALGLGAVGTLLFLYSFVFRVVLVTTGM